MYRKVLVWDGGEAGLGGGDGLASQKSVAVEEHDQHRAEHDPSCRTRPPSNSYQFKERRHPAHPIHTQVLYSYCTVRSPLTLHAP